MTTKPKKIEIINEQVEHVSVDALTVHPQNPRRGDLAAIVASIAAHGFYGALVAQRSSGYVLAGNHRLMAAREAGLREVPVAWVDVDDNHALRILAADNRTSDLGTYDETALIEVLHALEHDGGLAGTGYSSEWLEALICDLSNSALELSDDEFDAIADSEAPEDHVKITVTVYGDGVTRAAAQDAIRDALDDYKVEFK